jgi:glutamate 5-kinase
MNTPHAHSVSSELRQTVLAGARRIVVKIGTNTLTNSHGHLDPHWIKDLASQVVTLKKAGYEITIVSSGAVAAGVAELGLKSRPKDVVGKQAVAAVGQRRLMTHMHDAFEPHGLAVGQLLLTRADLDDRIRFLNLRNCVNRLHELGCVPIFNENDSVAVDEIRFGDNDMLAALVCNAVQADALVLLSVVDGLLDHDGRLVEFVPQVADVLELDHKGKSAHGTGGMTSKLEAVSLVTDSGHIAVIAGGRVPNVLLRLLRDAQTVGTVFAPARRKLDSRSRWIGKTKRPSGAVTIDQGAVTALCSRGKSLLAMGIVGVEGDFERGEVVSVRNPEGQEIARGLCNYNSVELRQIMGSKSSQFEKILGRPAFDEVIHRDNLVVL